MFRYRVIILIWTAALMACERPAQLPKALDDAAQSAQRASAGLARASEVPPERQQEQVRNASGK